MPAVWDQTDGCYCRGGGEAEGQSQEGKGATGSTAHLHQTLTAHCTSNCTHCTIHTVHWTLNNEHLTLNADYWTLYTEHCKLHIAHCINCTRHKFHTEHTALTLCPLQTLHITHWSQYKLHTSLATYISLKLLTLQTYSTHTLHQNINYPTAGFFSPRSQGKADHPSVLLC